MKRPTVRKRLVSAVETERSVSSYPSAAQFRYKLQQWYEDNEGFGEWRDTIDINATSMAQFPRYYEPDPPGTQIYPSSEQL